MLTNLNRLSQFCFLWSILLLLCILSCKKSTNNNICFYHWKTDTKLSDIEKEYLNELETKEIYVRYFDVTLNENKEIFPVAVVLDLDSSFKKYSITPVIFIANDIFESELAISDLATKINKLINQIHSRHLGEIPAKIQIDCDWTESSKIKYFELLSLLKKQYQLSVTLRLHQVKYKDKTGIPPADEASLMVYNIGDLKNQEQNSIFSNTILKQYLTKNTSYPLPLDLALPIYSWGIVTLPNQKIKIINNLTLEDIKNDSLNYIQLDTALFELKNNLFVKGLYVLKGSKIKIEDSNLDELIAAKQYLKNECTKINWSGKELYYHLDETVFLHHSKKQLFKLFQ